MIGRLRSGHDCPPTWHEVDHITNVPKLCSHAATATFVTFLALGSTMVRAENTGSGQSPINIMTDQAVLKRLDALQFSYTAPVTLTVVDTGAPDEEATARADVCPICGAALGQEPLSGNTLAIGDTVYDLVQFHLHAMAEHLIDGKQGAMELHLVHRTPDGMFAVVGQILNIGAENEALDPYFDALGQLAAGPVMEFEFSPSALIPEDLSSYRYTGSLTAPNASNPEEPFFEPIAWTVLAAPAEVSQAQYDAFVQLFPEGNSRAVQPLNGRTVLSDVAD